MHAVQLAVVFGPAQSAELLPPLLDPEPEPEPDEL